MIINMKIIFFILIVSIQAKAQIFTNATSEVYDGQGKVLRLTGSITRGIIIKNAIIEANSFEQIFDTTVTLINCKAREFSTAWFGAKSIYQDNSVYLQKCIEVCISNNICNLFVADSYSYSKSLKASSLYKGNYVGFALNIYGQGDMWNDRTTLTYTGNEFAFGVQVAKGGSIRNLCIRGNYQAPAKNDASYYNTPFSVRSGYNGIVIDYDGSKNTSGSSGYTIENTWVDGFDVLYSISPNTVTYNGDMIRLNHIRCGNGRIGVQSNQGQEKGNEINYIASWGSIHTLIQIGKSGKFQAGQYVVRGGNIAGSCVELFDISLAGWNGFSVDGLFAESLGRIGTILAVTSSYMPAVSLDKLYIRFALKPDAGSQMLLSTNSPNLKISNSNLWYYGPSGDVMNFSGPAVFENCDFGLSTTTTINRK